MHTMLLSSDQSRYGVLAKAVAEVVCSAPLSPKTGQPMARAQMKPQDRGFCIQVHTLSDDSSLQLDMPHVNVDTAKSCLAYVESRLAVSGFVPLT
jgi:hypothetical protein